MNTSTMSNHIIFIHDFLLTTFCMYQINLLVKPYFIYNGYYIQYMEYTYRGRCSTFGQTEFEVIRHRAQGNVESLPRVRQNLLQQRSLRGKYQCHTDPHIINSSLISWSREQLNKAKLRISRFKTKTWYKSYFLSMK